jgi:hypothetical protein
LLEAVLCVVVSLVYSVRATFGMRLNHRNRDWHTEEMREALAQAKPGIQLEANIPDHGIILGLVPRALVGPTRGQTDGPLARLEALNHELRDKPGNDSVELEAPVRTPEFALEARLLASLPGGSRDPARTRSALLTWTLTRGGNAAIRVPPNRLT